MSVDHLAGRRSGRPRGSKTTPAWVRDATWCYRNLDNPDAEPPSPFAKRLLDQARQRPDLLLVALAQLGCPPRREETSLQQARMEDAPTSGVRRLSVPVNGLLAWAMGHPAPSWLTQVPDGCELESVALHHTRRRLILTLRDKSFPTTPPGQPVPVVELD
jgi:hypothetical protein